MTVLAPARIGGLMMGVWFLATSVGTFISGRVSGLYEAMALPTLFGTIAATAIVFGIILMVLTPAMRRLLPAQPGPAPR
jgi:POT family proton-dependent oligopeptide transporter